MTPAADSNGRVLGDAFGPRSRPTGRAAARLVGIAASIAIALTGCSDDPRSTVVSQGGISNIRKVCDEGRAIYTFKAGYAGGIAVIADAPECAQ